MKNWLLTIIPKEWQTLTLWLAGVAVAAVFWGLSRLYYNTLHPRLLQHFEKKEKKFWVVLSHNFCRPLAWLTLLFGIHLGVGILPVNGNPQAVTGTVFRLSAIILTGWGLAGSSELVAYFLRNASSKMDIRTNRSVLSFLSSFFKIIVYAFVAVIFLSELGYDVNGLIAGLGLSGLTLALAAKDSAANFFAGLVLIFEKPFSVDEYITCGDISGTVKKIAFRTTTLRTMEDTEISVPNSILCSSSVTNWTRMKSRLVRFQIGLRYDTSTQTLTEVMSRLKSLLEEKDALVKGSVSVTLASFGDSSLNILVRYCIADPGYENQFTVNNEINLDIIRIVHDCETDFAFPSQSIYMES